MTSTDAPQTRVLVIDDNAAIHADINKILTPAGAASELDALEAELFGEPAPTSTLGGATSFIVDYASQGREGLQKVVTARQEGTPYALAFVDMRMPPGWDGVQTIERLWAEDPDLQTVICTAYSDHSWQEIAQRLQSFDRLLILKKPFDTVEIIQTAYNLAHKWRLQRQVNTQMETLNERVAQRTGELEKANLDLQSNFDRMARMESELRLAQKLESVGQLAAGVAHEINTPAQFVSDNLSFLDDSFGDLKKLLDLQVPLVESHPSSPEKDSAVGLQEEVELDYLLEEVPRAIAQSREGMRRVGEIVGAMKQFCHPGSNELKQVDLNAALNTTLTVARNEWKYVAEVESELDESLPPISANPAELNQVFLNLVVNAAHAMGFHSERGTKGTLGLKTARVDESTVQVQISDTGTGIPEEIGKKVFDPFFTTKPVGKGTGQGLALAHTVVVTQHGGDIRFESKAGSGTTFIITLPIQQPEAA